MNRFVFKYFKMINLFNKPFRHADESENKFAIVLIFGLFIFLFLFLFKPFGMNQLKPNSQLFISFGFGLVTSFVLIIIKYLIEPLLSKNKWTLGKEILWDLVIAVSIGIANYIYISLIFHTDFVLKYLLLSVWTAILVGIIPVTISIMISYNRRYKTALEEVSIIPEAVLWENEVIIRAGNPKNEIRLNPKNIVYLCSNDNYVTIVAMKGDSQFKKTIRGTLKSAESELRKNNRFIRCHKSYIVNLDYVDRITGHNQNLKIRLKPGGTDIPISRSQAVRLKAIHHTF